MKPFSNQQVMDGQPRSGRTVRLLPVLLILACAGPAAAWEFEAELGYESRYIEEGEKELDHGGVAALELELEKETELGEFSAGVELLTALAVNFREAEVSVGYGREVGDFAASLSWTRIIEEEGDEREYDNDLAAGLAYDGWEHVTPSVEYVYSTEARGGLLVLMLEGEIEVGGRVLSPYLLADIDYAYVSEDYDGLNHIEAGVEWHTHLTDDLEMTVHAAYSVAQENLRQEDEDGDYFWGGVSFSL